MIADAHIYDRHIPIVEELITRQEFEAPEFALDKKVKDFYQFTTESFKFDNYRFNEFKVKIPVAV